MRPSFAPLPGALRMSTVLHPVLLCAYLLLPTTVVAQMPYNPTRIFRNDTTLYVYRQSPSSPNQFELGSIDIASKVVTSNLPYTTLYQSLPFLDSKSTRAFTPVLNDGGNMTVYTGDCAEGAGGGKVWTYTPAKFGSGNWKQEAVSVSANNRNLPAMGSNYLSAGMAFSAVLGGDATDTGAYFFGGMCSIPGGNDDWQSAANYSNLMVTLEPSADRTQALTYQLDSSSSRGPPIAEAGFSLTGLTPSFSNHSDGTKTQQQNFVLIGGHTSAAFINMSQVALFSLPQQGWTFLPVLQPNTQRTDLAIREDVDQVEPRSGHSAVLTPDGRHIIVFGGWIGDINTPADPQLAVLNVGEGYGGQESWQWIVPSTSGSGLPSDTGLYGHGAVMLPGGVMMLMGGHQISASTSRQRRAQTTNSQVLFYNVSSNAWITEYNPPVAVPSEPANKGPLTNASQKAGLGVGLTVGMAAVLGLMVFYLWYTRRLKRQREFREKQLRDLALDAHRYDFEYLSPGADGRGARSDAMNYFDDHHGSYFDSSARRDQDRGWRRANGQDAERTGLLVEIPSPTRGLRRSLNSRASHQMPRYDERSGMGSSNIHPIDELEEEHEEDAANDQTPLRSHHEMAEKKAEQRGNVFDNAPVLDPFTDDHNAIITRRGRRQALARSAPASPTRAPAEASSHGPIDALSAIGILPPRRSSPHSNGRTSPDKSDRTGSSLSELSFRSNLSSNSTNGGVARSVSIRSTVLRNSVHQANPFRTPEDSPTSAHLVVSGEGWESPVDLRTRSLTSIRSTGNHHTYNDGDSFTTARTSFIQLQAEGEALLGGNPDRPRPGTSSTSNASNAYTHDMTESSISRGDVLTAATSVVDGSSRNRDRRKSWLGSVRRALGRTSSTADARTKSLTDSTPQLESYRDEAGSPNAAEAKRTSSPASAPPRRAVSDASFWRSKRGKQDWLDDEVDPSDPEARWRRTSGDNWGTPEDLALAEKERQRREWRERGNLIRLADDGPPTPRTPIQPGDLGVPEARQSTPPEEDDWDVEAAVERRVVQVMFTVPKSKLRVVNADEDRSSLLSLPRESTDDNKGESSGAGSPSRVKDLAERFEQMSTTSKESPKESPRPSPSPSIRSIKTRSKVTSTTPEPERKSRLVSEDITAVGR